MPKKQGRGQKFLVGRYKTVILMFNYRFDVIFRPYPLKSLPELILGGYIIYTPYIPRRYAPAKK